ncbi:unnamed protein product [Orchesella dallaii]|uniref:Eukaryotic translation initiation factor 4 gamma 2 n=1 Tax=Orchesella dallaii TaxID=48710 RepID=A0ABP1PYU2_9HEXA
MYAQLCKKLSKKVPNFDPPNPDNTTTFRRLLVNKCQDEYANRARASAMYDQRTGNLTPEEEEEKLLAKRKMLGNIKFIGELGKLEMLTHSILHKCCEELVKKTKAEDLECLCQIMSTCGHLLDNDKGKYLMDQYFDRMKELSENEKLPARIRFMLQDVIELRDNHWLPRKTISLKESPKPIQEIRREAHDELGISDGSRSPTEEFRYLQIDPRRNGRIFGPKKRTGLEDVFAPVPIAMTSLGTGPGVITPGEKSLGMETNGFHTPPPMNNYRPAGGMRGYNPPNNMAPNNMAPNNPQYYQQHKNNMKYHHNHNNMHHNHNHEHNNHGNQMNMHQNMRNNQNNMNNHGGYEKSPVAPRFMKQAQQANQGMVGAPPMPMSTMPMANDELSFRPPPNSMIKMIPQPMKPPTFVPPIMDPRKSPVTAVLPPPVINNPPPVENPLMQAGNRNTLERKKNKAPTKDDIIKKVDDIIGELLNKKSSEQALEAMKELKMPDRLYCDVTVAILNKAMDHNETDRESIYSFVVYLVEQEFITVTQFQDSFRVMLDLMGELEADIPRIKSYVAAFAGRAICQGQMTIAEVADLTENGKHYPFLLLVLQHMGKTMERTKLCKLFDESKVNLLTTLPKTDRTKDRMGEILEERELSFLFPLLKIQSEMAKRLQINSDPTDFLEWVKGQVDVTYQTSQGFIHALMTVIFKFINGEGLQGIKGNPTQAPEKQMKEKEKALLLKYKPVISTFLQDRVDLQVIAIYALQSAWFALECPKVMLLRWFMNTYELDLIEEDSFLKWKEDIRDDYPGKGKALFQVNQWLNWLEEEEDEGEEGEGDE